MNIKNYSEFKRQKLDKYFLLTTLLILFHLIANIIWIRLNEVPPQWDGAFHTLLSFNFADYIRNNLLHFNFIDFLKISKYYPPFVHLIGAILVFFVGYQEKIIQLTGTLFLSLTIYFLFLYANTLFNNRRVAFLSTFFFSFFLIIFQQSRLHMLDIPLTALVVAGFYFLHVSDYLTRRKQSLLFFTSLAIALLIKWTAVVFFIIPLLFLLFQVSQHKYYQKKIIKNVILGLLLVGIICVPWYMINSPSIVQIGSLYLKSEAADPQQLFSLENIFFYPKLLLVFQTGFFGGVMFIISSFFLLKYKRYQFVYIFSIISFIYIIFTFIGNKNIRFLIPLMPLISMIMAYGTDRIITYSKSTILLSFCAFVIFYYIVSFFLLSFGIPIYPKYKYTIKFPLIGWIDVVYWHDQPVKVIYDQTIWPNDKLAKVLLSKSIPDQKIYYFINSEKPYLNASTINLALYRVSNGIPSGFHEADTNFFHVLKGKTRFANYKEIDDYVNLINVLFIPLSEIGQAQAIIDYIPRKQLQEYMLNNINPNYIAAEEISLPDGDVVRIYQRKM